MIFSPEFFKANRRRLLSEVQADSIVLTANGLMQSAADSTFPFKQDSNFWYLTGIDEPDIILVIHSSGEFLITPGRSKVRVIFDGQIDNASLSKTSGVKQILDEASGLTSLKKLLKGRVATVFPPPGFIKQAGFYTNPSRARLVRRLKSLNSSIKLTDLRSDLAALRMIKQPAEIQAIKKAVQITAEAFQTVMARRSDFKTERQIEVALNSHFRLFGQGPAFSTIVAGGGNACTLHYEANNARLSKQDLVLIDAGASFEHYAGDLTRTISLKPPTDRQQVVYNAVLSIQKYAINLIKPGLKIKQYTDSIDSFATQQLQEIGLLKASNSADLHKYCPHGVSHFLGLDVHDVADYRPDKKNKSINRTAKLGELKLQKGMVLTVEPGIYIPEERLGIRIEDNILINASGAENLSANLARSLN